MWKCKKGQGFGLSPFLLSDPPVALLSRGRATDQERKCAAPATKEGVVACPGVQSVSLRQVGRWDKLDSPLDRNRTDTKPVAPPDVGP